MAIWGRDGRRQHTRSGEGEESNLNIIIGNLQIMGLKDCSTTTTKSDFSAD